MAPPQKGKQGTKGAKQIVEENVSTLNFYRNMAIISNALSLIILVFYNSTISIVLYLFSCLVYIGSYQFMVYMAKPKYSESGQLLDSGVDLNMEGGIAEHVKDIIILTAGCSTGLAIIANRGFTELPHPSYSLDLASCYFFLKSYIEKNPSGVPNLLWMMT
ncbi:hypothetical protein Zmor_006910 [Zophobas morio]|uniref:Transmembrane protein 208 n=1 Tax=Zophobas morio TaxID=2755281 RepID=A0AA38IVV6_9CUCU|nr:hypothetical protein Zmor_006910 [Zophobas morio]